ncbi:MAG TPA: hypothetical protein DEB40_13630 [Elusimicrobia bacterium]|nr:hypothetical protein [Elusimicrobiota bacterium]HBT62775.1 hypothetical protein [Elusimicrobiota bacterium]
MNRDKDYRTEHLNPMPFEEYGKHVRKLMARIREYLAKNKIAFDAVAPILRSGGVPGGMLAVYFDIPVMIPLQFKYRYRPTRLEQVLPFPRLKDPLPERPKILICENNTSSGETARTAVGVIRERYPAATIFYATVAKVYGGPDVIEGVEESFYGVRTNERLLATAEQARAFDLRADVTLFPWEVAEKELSEMNAFS